MKLRGHPQPKRDRAKVTVVTDRVVTVRYTVRCNECGTVYADSKDYQAMHDLRFAHEEAHQLADFKKATTLEEEDA